MSEWWEAEGTAVCLVSRRPPGKGAVANSPQGAVCGQQVAEVQQLPGSFPVLAPLARPAAAAAPGPGLHQ